MTTQEESSLTFTLLYGIAPKSYFDMTNAERKKATAMAFERAKEAAFTLGLPIIYGKNGEVIAEYSDGRQFIRENGKDMKPYDGK